MFVDMGSSTADTVAVSDVPLHADDAASVNKNQPPTDGVERQAHTQFVFDRDYRFWSIIFALCTMQVLCSLENTVVVTSLPTIVQQLDLGSSYIWVTNIFFLTT